MNFNPLPVSPPTATSGSHVLVAQPQVRAMLQMCEAPGDAPDVLSVFAGVLRCLDALAFKQPAVRSLAAQMRDTPHQLLLSAQAPSTSVVSLLARKQRLATWAAMREVGRADLTKLPVNEATIALSILGAALLRGHLSGTRPDAKVVARAREALARPLSTASRSWSPRARERSLSSQLRLLEQTVLADLHKARQLGLTTPVPVLLETQSSEIAMLNAAVKRRVASLTAFGSASEARASDGHGSLPRSSVLATGERLRVATSAGDDVALMMCLEILTNFTPQVIAALPLGPERDARGIAPLAWFDLANGRYCHVAWWLRDRGAQPEPTAHTLYFSTTDIVNVPLPPFLSEQLRRRLALVPQARVMGELCSNGEHHPWRTADRQTGGYRISVRRLHRGVVSHLIGQDLGRLPVALLTSQLGLVSRGRLAYGLVHQSQLESTALQMYKVLDWGEAAKSSAATHQYFGSAVTPTDDAVERAFQSLADQVDTADRAHDTPTPESLRRLVNKLNAWLSALMALLLALRNALEYPILASELRFGSVHVNDKRVHLLGPGPALPVMPLLLTSLAGAEQKIAATAASLHEFDASHPIHQALAAMLAPDRPAAQVITSTWTVQIAGTSTWRQELPPSLRLVGNFGRHFWPHRLAMHGAGQAELAVLLRHSASDIESTSTTTVTSPTYRSRRLLKAMEATIQSLALARPRCLA